MNKAILKIVFVVLIFSPAIYFQIKQFNEQRAIESYLSENGLSNLDVSRESALKVVELVRKDFNTDVKTFKKLGMQSRPFLRETTEFLLDAKEGLCGEGTRVIINLLYEQGFDVSRITLYNRHLHGSHTLVSVVIDGEEFLLDSINSSYPADEILREEVISTKDFLLTGYESDYNKRKAISRQLKETTISKNKAFFEKYLYYSYEAVPSSKLLNVAGVNTKVLNFTRPPKLLSILAERPNQLLAIVSFFVALFITLFCWLLLAKTSLLSKRK